MLKPEIDPIREQLAQFVEQSALDLLDPERLQAIAEDLRLVARRRTLDAGLVTVSLILSALQRSTDTEGRLLDARRTYEMLGGGAASESGFRKKTRQVKGVLHELLRRRLGTVVNMAPPELRGRLASLRDILIPDGCAFKLANELAGVYDGTGQAAELKLHAVYSVRSGGVFRIERTAGNVHDNDGFAPESFDAGSLYIWDLGYNDYNRVVKATLDGALVLQRLKSGANPIVLASYGEGGARREIVAEDGRRFRLEDACSNNLVHKQRVLDLDVELKDERGRKIVARVVCVPYGGEDRYYLTTLPRDRFSPHDIAELYRMRWEVELFFRGLKGALRLDEVRRLVHRDSLDAIVSASLLAAVLARDLTTWLNDLAQREARHADVQASDNEAFPPGDASYRIAVATA
jgi:putative transposase